MGTFLEEQSKSGEPIYNIRSYLSRPARSGYFITDKSDKDVTAGVPWQISDDGVKFFKHLNGLFGNKNGRKPEPECIEYIAAYFFDPEEELLEDCEE